MALTVVSRVLNQLTRSQPSLKSGEERIMHDVTVKSIITSGGQKRMSITPYPETTLLIQQKCG